MDAKTHDAAPDDDKLVLGLLHIGQIELAVPTVHLREAVNHPARLSPLLSASPHVVGAIDVRGDLVPVISLRHALGNPGCAMPYEASKVGHGRIVIMGHGDHLFGIAVDALGGVVTVPTSQSRQVEVLQSGSPLLVKRLFSQDAGARVVNVLSLEGVMQLVDLPLLRCVARQDRHLSATDAVAQTWRPYVLFECAGVRLAMDANVVDTVINIDNAHGGLSRSNGCLGLIQTDTRRMAVVDALTIIGLGNTDSTDNRQVLVLKRDGHAVGVLIRHVTQIARLNEGTRRHVPTMAFERPEFFDGMLPLEGQGDFLCISAAAFLATTEVSSMASIHGRPLQLRPDSAHPRPSMTSVSHTSTAANAGRAEVYLTFRIGHEFAAPLKQVREILPMPQRMTPIRRGDARIGLFTHRERIVPIIDMAILLGTGRIECSSETRLLLIDTTVGQVAMMVERVHAIETVQWSHTPIAQSQWRNADALEAALNARGLLTLGEGGTKRPASALDLPRIAQAIEAHYTPADTLSEQPRTCVAGTSKENADHKEKLIEKGAALSSDAIPA